ncbi:M1 family metallopeptidase [Winogradskya humida]
MVAGALVLMLAGCSAGDAPVPVMPASPKPVVFSPGSSGIGDPYFPSAGNGGYDVGRYDLKLRYEPSSGRLDGTATITATATQNLSGFHLDLTGLTVREVTVNGLTAVTSASSAEVAVAAPTGIKRGKKFTVVVSYGGTPREIKTPVVGPGGWHRTARGTYALGEPFSAGAWFPANDHPADKAAFALEMTVPQGLTAISNGIPGRSTSRDGRTTWRWSQAAPMATYLAFVAIGKYRVTTSTHQGKPMITAVPATMSANAPEARALARTGEIADWFEKRFGPYPFDAYGGVVIDDPGLDSGLETQTRPVYSRHALDGSSRQNTAVIAHELAHQWFGNSVSLTRWQDFWLSEGFATYAEWLWLDQEGGPTVEQTVHEQYTNYPWQVLPAEDPGPDGLLSSGPYERGAMALHALRTRIGDTSFFKLLRSWTKTHANGNVTTADFIAAAERISGQKLGEFFDVWLSGSYRPTY